MIFLAQMWAGFWMVSALAGTTIAYGRILPPDRAPDYIAPPLPPRKR